MIAYPGEFFRKFSPLAFINRRMPVVSRSYFLWWHGSVGRTSLPYCRPSGTLVNQGNPFKMKGNVTRPADVKRGKLPRKTSGNPYGALAQLVGRGSSTVTPSGRKSDQKTQWKIWSENLPNGALAQMVARDIRIVEVRGSTPLCSTKIGRA